MRHLIPLVLTCLLCACSKTDSLQVFDEKAAANFLNQGSTTYRAKERIKISSKNKPAWQRIDMSYGTVGSPIMLIPPGESRERWTQSVRTYLYPYQKDPNMTPEKWVEEALLSAKTHCERVKRDYLALNKRSATYRYSMEICNSEEKSQIRIGKAFSGEDAVYVIYYTAKLGSVSDKDIRDATQLIEHAELVKNTTALYQSSSIHD